MSEARSLREALAASGRTAPLAHASPHLTLPCVKSAPARAASCMRMRSAARSNSCLHLSEQKKYRRFLYSLLGVLWPLSTRTPQIGSYERPPVFSPEFTFPAPDFNYPALGWKFGPATATPRRRRCRLRRGSVKPFLEWEIRFPCRTNEDLSVRMARTRGTAISAGRVRGISTATGAASG